jgi:hypothetical protein
VSRKAFNFFRSYYDVAKEIPEKYRGKFLMAVCDYEFSGIIPDFSDSPKVLKLAWVSIFHSLEKQLSGYNSATSLPTPQEGSIEGSLKGSTKESTKQEKEEVKEKEQLESKSKREKKPKAETSVSYTSFGEGENIKIESDKIQDIDLFFEFDEVLRDACITLLDDWLQTNKKGNKGDKECKGITSFKAYCRRWVKKTVLKEFQEQGRTNTGLKVITPQTQGKQPEKEGFFSKASKIDLFAWDK